MCSFEPKYVENVVHKLFRPGRQGQVLNLIIAYEGRSAEIPACRELSRNTKRLQDNLSSFCCHVMKMKSEGSGD